MLSRLFLSAVLSVPLITTGACTDPAAPPAPAEVDSDPIDSPDLSAGDDFVAVPHAVSREESGNRRAKLRAAGAPVQRTARVAADRDFYVGIRKEILAERYFLSAFLEQYFPGAVNDGAAMSLGTRVVSFKIQNGSLFMFDASDRHTTSSVFDPEILVEAYPIVDNAFIRSIPHANNYVFFDPSTGVARIDLLRDYFGSNPWPVKFDRELAFNQNFKQLSDGVAFEQVFTGTADQPIGDGQIEIDTFRASGTLGISLRRYQEGAHYHEVELPWQEHYFRSDPKLVPNTTNLRQTAAHWDIYPGMQPIEWVISPALKQVDDSPAYADVDLVGAVKAGVEAWNTAFGFPAFRARVATANESFGQDNKNYIIFDPEPSIGFAFANWRTNPNTGEIRGASVYFGANWIDRTGIDSDPVESGTDGGARAERATRAAVKSLRWAGLQADPLCVQWSDEARARLPRAGGGATNLTGGQKLEAYLSHMIVHEIGHNLGLRHNFAGSLIEPTSSSVMDYTLFETRIQQGATVGPYDVDAVRYLYGLSPELPSQRFCTDFDLGFDPECQKFDTGADPFATSYQPNYSWIRDSFVWGWLGEESVSDLQTYGRPVYDFATNGDFFQAQRGWQLLLADVGAPVAPWLLAEPSFNRSGADLVMRKNLELVMASANPAIIDAVEDQAGLVLRNEDGIRSAKTRRVVVDLLKARQSTRSYGALLAARDVIADQMTRGELSADALLEARDLLARIDRATSPYFQ